MLKKIKTLFILLFVFILITGCSKDNTSENKTNDQPQKVQTNEVKQNTESEVATDESATKESSSDDQEDKPKYITEEDFNKKYKKDPEEKQYKDGKFELADGSIIKADDYSYGESDIFDYASAIFKNGTLVHLQIETDKSQEEIEEGLGITFNDGNTVIENRIGYEINFDETFLDENISVFPNEW